MKTTWLYLQNGQVHGPLSMSEVKDRAAKGQLGPDDLLWPQSHDRRSAARACSAINFTSLMPTRSADLPDWLDDVAATQEFGPASARWRPLELPPWLDDVLRFESMDGVAPPTTEPIKDATPHVESLATKDKPRESQAQTSPTVPVPRPKIGPPPVPLATPVKRTESTTSRKEPRSQPPPFPPPPFPPPPPNIPENFVPLPPPPPAAIAIPPSTATPTLEVKLPPSSSQAAQTRAAPERAVHYSVPPAAPPEVETIFEVVLKGRAAISRWADLDEVKHIIMKGDVSVLRETPSLLETLAPYEKYGKAVVDKLWQEADWTVNNRYNYYSALQARG